MNALPCPCCHRLPRPEERHGLLDGLTDEGEPLGFTCLDVAGEVIFDLPSCTACGADDACSCPSPF